MKKKLIILDFDGVLTDSFECCFSLIKASMKHIGLSLTRGQYRNFFIENVHQGFRDFINDEDKYSSFAKFRAENFDKYYNPSLFPGVGEILKKLNKDYVLAIASSGKKSVIVNLLKRNKIFNLFDMVLVTAENTKENMLREILQKNKASPCQTLMITDTIGDLKIAKKNNLRTAALSWGFHSEKLLKQAKPDYLAKSLKMLYKDLTDF